MGCGRLVSMTSMLPAPPKTMGKLGDVLISALASVRGEPNDLALTSKRSVLVLLVDGLGRSNLQESGAHASFLNSQKSIDASCFFPSTTAAGIVSFATGQPPWETNFIGYQVFNRADMKGMNLLSGWEDQETAIDFQPLKTVPEMAISFGIEFHTIAPAVYRKSGFTAATMREATFHGIDSLAERFQQALELLHSANEKVVYLYVPELDQAAHAKGWNSSEWRNLLEDVDAQISMLAKALPKKAGFLVTSDHGIVDIPKSNHIYLDEYLDESELHFVGGDTRGLYLYLKDPDLVESTKEKLEVDLGDSCYLVTPDVLVHAGYWQRMPDKRITPDLVVLAKKNIALYHRAFAKRKSLEMIGHHGSITREEMSIPLITFGF